MESRSGYYNGWEAIDHISIMALVVSQYSHYDDVPAEHVEAWAIVWVDILEYMHAAVTEVELCRALKWMMIAHDLLLRLPPRGGMRGRDHVAQRFMAWNQGDMAKLIRWWTRDRA